MELHDNINK